MDKLRYEDYIEQNGSLTYTNVGVSMLPLLRQGKDMFIVSKRDGQRCKVGDVVLYKRPPDQYVLHRIIKVRQIQVLFFCMASFYTAENGMQKGKVQDEKSCQKNSEK